RRRPTRTHPQRLRRLSAARNVVLDNQKATISPESGARLALFASTHSCTRVDELGTNRVRNAQLSCVDSGAGGNRMLFRAARRGGTFRLSRAAFVVLAAPLLNAPLCEPNREPEREWGRDIAFDGDFCACRPRLRAGRRRMAHRHEWRTLSRFRLGCRRERARPCASASRCCARRTVAEAVARIEPL